ncbi:MAG: 50S ribosomal protein L20 [Candidatus Cloacimonetes bacterium]|nr:50S ribosomal protein L20 [Candidatus Cloacimonadota bacterium]
MSRATNNVASHRRHKKYLKAAKGYRGTRGKLYRTARQTVEKGWCYAYRDRKQKKRMFRRLWITRINAGARANGLTYSTLINGLNKAQMQINRKVLAHLAMHEQNAFTAICTQISSRGK